MDYGALPPEINSARMYSGPGAGSMLAAAAAWDGLAAELHTAATRYQWVTSGLAGGPWQGAASASMATAAAPYVAWLTTTATQAEQTAGHHRAAASGYEAAHAMTVPPPLIAANRAQLMSLVATNILGQNSPAIAATEAHYAEMWAQDAAAMYGYATSSAAAPKVTPFSPAPTTTNPAALTNQSTAVAQAAAISAAVQGQEVMSATPQLMSAVPQALQGLASSSPSSMSSTALSYLSKLSELSTPAKLAMYPMTYLNTAMGLSKSAGLSAKVASAGVTAVESGLAGGVGSGTGALGSAGLSGGAGAASAGLGRGFSIGALSVPQSWPAAATPISPVGAELASTGWNAAPAAGPAGMPLMPIAGMAGRGAGAPRLPGSSCAPP